MHDQLGWTGGSVAHFDLLDARLSASIASAIDITPTFIIGPPRSGTTLLAQILAHGENVLSLSEPFFAVRALRPRASRMMFQILRSYFHWHARVPPTTCTTELFGYLRACAWAKHQRLIIKEVFSEFDRPHPFSNTETTNAIADSGAAIIAIVRDPYDTVASTLRAVNRYLTGWRRRLFWLACEAIPHFKCDEEIVRHATRNWALFADWVRRDCRVLVRYEDLIHDPAAEVRRICDRVALPFHERMIAQRRRPASFGGLGDLNVVLGPSRSIHNRAVGRGRTLTPAAREIVRKVCGPSAAELGYPE